MINGAHLIIYSKQAEKLRAFFREVLQFPNVDAGGGWLIFALPPAEIAFHPTSKRTFHELYFMCDDIKAIVASLKKMGVKFNGRITDQGWGLLASMKLPDGSEMGLYQPRHASPLKRRRPRSRKQTARPRR